MEDILRKRMTKIRKHSQIFFSNVDHDILKTKFGQATDEEIIPAMIDEHPKENLSWINVF
jgi:hypothetical protein